MTAEVADRRTAIVTGGSRGFGRAVANRLCADGWLVIIDGRRSAPLEATAQALGAVAVPGDVTDALHRRRVVSEALLRTGRLDLLVNNAGALGPSPLPVVADLDPGLLRALLEVNVVAPLALVQEALPSLCASGGAVVNVTSDAAVEPYPGWGGYGASKAALEQLSAVLAEEVGDGIRVWWLDPGDMRTEMHQQAFPGQDISDRSEPEQVAPAVSRLFANRPVSGRYRAAELLAIPVGDGR